MHLSYKILIGMVLGVIAGLVAGPTSAPLLKVWVTPVGTIFINLIKMIIVPVVLASLIVGAAALGDIKKLGRVGAKIMGFYNVPACQDTKLKNLSYILLPFLSAYAAIRYC